MKNFKPMLAGKAPADLSKLRYPLLASPKLDGIRCIIIGGRPMSRALKPIPNAHVQAALGGGVLPDGIDGELMVEGGFNSVQSAFMRKGDGTPFDFWFFAFDWLTEDAAIRNGPASHCGEGFEDRLERLTLWSEEHGHNNLHVVEHVEITNADDLLTYNAEQLAAGFEGTMVREPGEAYKFGRSTTCEGGLLKIKHFVDEEALVIGVEERMHNDNEATTDELGHTKRSSAKAGLRPAGDMGKLVCRTPDGAEFRIGTGFTQEQREDFWSCRQQLVGATLTFKHQPDPGGRKPGQAPRIPVFIGLRHLDDTAS